MKFHVLFTIRRILYELKVALPKDIGFKPLSNPYNKVAYEKICKEFNVPLNSDFRYRGGDNHGLGV